MKMRNNKIAFIGGRGIQSNYGGVENSIRCITHEIATLKDCAIYVSGHGDKAWFESIVNPNKVKAINSPIWANAIGHWCSCLLCLFYLLIVVRPGTIYIFASGPNALCIIARIFGIKTVACLRAIDSKREKWGIINKGILKFGEFSATRIAHVCTVNSVAMQRYFIARGAKTTYIPNGISSCTGCDKDLLGQFNISRNGYILFAARLDPVKRLDILLQAYALLPAELRVPLIVAGGYAKSEKYEQGLKELAMPSVQFVGHIDEPLMSTLMDNCGIFVLPSVLEGMSNSLLSAMGAGRCIICADVPENADVVNRDKRVLYERDNSKALSAMLETYLGDHNLREEIGMQMRQLAEQEFSWNETAKSFLRLAAW